MSQARYDGYADWYDQTFRSYADLDGPAGLVARLVGPADSADPVCVDVGCGTGLCFAALTGAGYRVIGIDLSADQLRVAASRVSTVVRADARTLPLAPRSVSTVVMAFTHTDVDDFGFAVAEVARVLRPGGRLVYLGTHPAYVGAFVDRSQEVVAGDLRFVPGYGEERLQQDPTGRFPMRSRVGARYLALTTLLDAFVAQDTLRVSSVQEFDTA